MADGFDVVAVRVADEGPVVIGVVLGPEPRLVQHLGAGRDRGGEERAHRRAVGRGQGDVRLAEPLTRVEGADLEVGLRRPAVPDGHREIHDATPA